MTKGKSQILSGFCPNPHCQKKLFFLEHEASIECSGCGQRHIQSSLQSLEKAFNHPGLVEAMEGLLLQLRKIDASRKKSLEQEDYKINGLSNYLCTILSSLLTTHGMDKNSGKAKLLVEMGKAPVFDCGQLCDRAFLIDPAHLKVTGFGTDRSGSSTYLRDTLNVIKLSNDNEERLVPIHADGDGHCLLHSVSRALVGWELFWHPLRVNLKQHFIQNLSKYKLQFLDFIDDSEWRMIVEECDPDFAASGTEPTGLRNIHIFGLANVLRRPIILLDSMEGIQSPGDYSAIFLPIFSTPAACKNKDGVLNTPLCIAWSSLGRNHFIPLVGVKGKKCPVLSRHMIQRAWGVSDVEIDNYVHFENGHCQIGGEKGLQIGYVQRLVSAMNEVFLQQHSVCASLVADVYQHIFKANGLVFGVNLDLLLDKTKNSTEEKQLFVCLGCHCLAFSQPLEDDGWCLPGGELYDLAISCHGTLKDGQSYSFPIHDIIAKYDKGRDRLNPVKGSRKPTGCLYCSGLEFRLVKPDYTVLFQNGDRTQTKSSVCTCGFKHFWNGREYDTAPKQVLVLMEWGGRTVKEIVPWFQNELDLSLNSNVYQMAQDLVQKSFPGEFGSERLVQKVVDQILLQTDNPSKVEELKTLVQNHNNEASPSDSSSAAASAAPRETNNDVMQMEVGDDGSDNMQRLDGSGSGSWSRHQPSKAIITGRQTQSVHKEELNMSNAERQARQRIEKNAAIQQRKSSEHQKQGPNKTSNVPKSITTTPPPPPTTLNPKSPSTTPSSPSTPNATTSVTTPTKPAPANMANKRIRLATSDGRNLTLDLPAQCTFLELQALVSNMVGVPPERQKIRHGFPPVELKAPSTGDPDYRVPIQPGDRIMLDIVQEQAKGNSAAATTGTSGSAVNQEHNTANSGPQHHIKGPTSAWNSFASSSSARGDLDEVSDRVLQSLMDPLLGSGGDNLDRSLSALALTAALEQKDLWTYVQRMPHLFSVDGLFYKQVERDMGLEHGKHCTLPLLPHKVFVYNGQHDRLELCLEPYGHFPIENKVESRAQSLLPTSHCRSKSQTPFSGQGHSLRSVSSQEDRMPTDVPMSPKRLEARRLNNMCDPSIHQESIEEEDEEGDENAMKTDSTDANDLQSASSHLLRPDELMRQSPSKAGVSPTLHMPGPDSKMVRRGPGYSELSPIPENSFNEKAEMLQQLVSRIEQAVKSMGQEADKVEGVSPTAPSLSSTSSSVHGIDNDNIPFSNATVASTIPDNASTSNNANSTLSHSPVSSLLSSSLHKVSAPTNAKNVKTSPNSSLPPSTMSFPSPSAILLSSSIMSGSSSRSGSERNSPVGSSQNCSDNEMAGGEGEPKFPTNHIDRLQSQSPSSFREEGPMEDENSGGGGCDIETRSRVAVYAEEMASSLLAMDDDFNDQTDAASCGAGVGGGALEENGEEGHSELCDNNGEDKNAATTTGEEEEMDSADSEGGATSSTA